MNESITICSRSKETFDSDFHSSSHSVCWSLDGLRSTNYIGRAVLPGFLDGDQTLRSLLCESKNLGSSLFDPRFSDTDLSGLPFYISSIEAEGKEYSEEVNSFGAFTNLFGGFPWNDFKFPGIIGFSSEQSISCQKSVDSFSSNQFCINVDSDFKPLLEHSITGFYFSGSGICFGGQAKTVFDAYSGSQLFDSSVTDSSRSVVDDSSCFADSRFCVFRGVYT